VQAPQDGRLGIAPGGLRAGRPRGLIHARQHQRQAQPHGQGWRHFGLALQQQRRQQAGDLVRRGRREGRLGQAETRAQADPQTLGAPFSRRLRLDDPRRGEDGDHHRGRAQARQ
jgi:hypothetical protein